MIIDLNSILAILGVISPFILAAVWMINISVRISNRALVLESQMNTHNQKITNLEKITSYESLEKIVEKVCKNIFNSPDFKHSMKLTIEDVFLHIEKTRPIDNSFEERMLVELKKLQQDIVKLSVEK